MSNTTPSTPDWARDDLEAPEWARTDTPEVPDWAEEGEVDPVYRPFSEVREDIDPASLRADPDWLLASRMVYESYTGSPYEGDDQELAQWGLEHLGQFNYNLVNMGVVSKRLLEADQETKEAFLYMMDTYDNTNVSWGGVGRFLRGVATDPTTYVGLGTLGAGLVGKAGANVGTKAGLRALLRQGVGRTGVVAGIEGGMYSGFDNTMRQGIEVSAGRREERDMGELATSVGVGAVAGTVLGTAADAGLTGIQNILRQAPEGTRSPSVGAAQVDPAATPEATPRVRPEASEAPRNGSEVEKLRGRRESDDAVPLYPEEGHAEDLTLVPETNTGLRSTPMSMEELTEAAQPVVRSLRTMAPDEVAGNLEVLRRGDLPLEQSRVLMRGVHVYTDELKVERADLLKELQDPSLVPQSRAEIQARLDEVEEIIVPLEMADEAFSSMAGSILRQRQEGLTDLRGVSVETIMERYDVDRVGAEQLYIEAVETAHRSAEGRRVTNQYAQQIDQALAAGDLQKATELTMMRHRELETLAGLDTTNRAGFMRKLNEVAISNVFSATTLMINAVPSGIKGVVIPGVRAVLTDPLSRATRVEAGATYSAMRSTFGSAWNAAKASWRYEQSLLTRRNTTGLSLDARRERVDSGRFLEEGLALRGRWAGAFRFFPRALNATDEFFSQINYAGFVAGRAASEAAIEGAERGLRGAELDEHIREASRRAIDEAFKVEDADDLIQPIINKGINLGHSGEDLVRYVEKEAARNPAALRRGTDEEALEYVQDVLFKRPFSGEGSASAMAQGYEDIVAKAPSLKFVFGQLFFRTPVRVFEEGIRMTPGVQILAPNFLQDLAGNNGQLRQIRARGEALASFAFTGAVMSLYAEGRITGDGAYDHWRQQRHRGDTDLPPPYTITMRDGSTWSYRNFDPIATPMKIMVNALERMDRLAIREAQGEFVDASTYQQVASQVTVGTMAVAAALRDANLTAGIDGTLEFFETLSDPEEGDGMVRLMGEKLNLLVPNTLRKIARQNDPTIKDPATFWQTVENSFSPVGVDFGAVQTPYSYDALGNVRTITDVMALKNIFSTASVEEREKGRSEQELTVMRELDRLAQETGMMIRAPYKHPMLGDLDLRTVMTGDGEETLYDRWQRNFREQPVTESLYPILTADLPDGTFKHRGARVTQVQGILSEYRNAAFQILLANEEQAILRHVQGRVRASEAEAGLWDFRRPAR